MAGAALIAGLLRFGPAQAMDIVQYDTMANQDRQDFLDSLSRDAEAVLKQEGRSDDASKVHLLFNDIRPGDNLPVGEAELEMNLASARVRDAEKQLQSHANPRVQVEVALIGTIRNNGIPISPDFIKGLFAQTAAFRPKYPPLVAPAPPPRAAPPAVSHPKSDDDDPIGSGGFITPPKSK